MIDQKGFGGNMGVVGSGRSLYIASLFFLNIGLARSMGPEGFGSFQQVFIFSVLFTIFMLGIPETMYFFLPRLKDDEKTVFLGQTIVLLCIAGITVALLLWLGASPFARILKNSDIKYNIRLFGIYGAFLIASSFADPVFILYEKVKYLFLLSALHALFFITLTVWQYFMKSSIMILFAAMSVFGGVKLILALMLLHKLRHKTGKIRYASGTMSVVLMQLSFALPIALTNAMDIISKWLDKFVVSFFLGTEPLGIFSVGAVEIPFIGVFIGSIYSVISPKLNKLIHDEDYEGFLDLITKTLKFTAKFVWPAWIYLFIFGDHLISLVFTHSFEGAVAPFRIYLLLMPLRIFLFGVIVIALGHPGVILRASFLSLIANLILSIVLVHYIGFIGPAIATVASTYLQAMVLILFILHTLNIRIHDLLPFRTFFSIALISALAAAVAFFFTSFYINDFMVVLISLTIFLGLYIILGMKAGLFRFFSLWDILQGQIFGKKD